MNTNTKVIVDLQATVKKHSHQMHGKQVLYFPKVGKHTKAESKLLVVMSALKQGNNFMYLRSFLESQEHDLLFLNDPQNTWYLDNDHGETYNKILLHFTKKYQIENVFLFGFSMSGYGSILHALKLNANAIACDPQINIQISKDYAWPELKDFLNSLGDKYINIDEYAIQGWKDSAIYLLHGHHDMDVVNANLLANTPSTHKKLVLQSVDIESHDLFFGKNLSYIYNAINFLSLYRRTSNFEEFENKTNTNNRRDLRLERTKFMLLDPYRTLPKEVFTSKDMSEQVGSGFWQNRYLYQKNGRIYHFENTGLYVEDQLLGTTCIYDGKGWRLLYPKPTLHDNLIADVFFKTHNLKLLENNELINDRWWVRNEKKSIVSVSGTMNHIQINLESINSRNIFLNCQLKLNKNLIEELIGKYLTLTAKVFTDKGEIFLSLGGVGKYGFFHKTSNTSKAGKWSYLSVFEQFISIDPNHPESIFFRINIGTDGICKEVHIKDLQIFPGYFPMGII